MFTQMCGWICVCVCVSIGGVGKIVAQQDGNNTHIYSAKSVLYGVSSREQHLYSHARTHTSTCLSIQVYIHQSTFIPSHLLTLLYVYVVYRNVTSLSLTLDDSVRMCVDLQGALFEFGNQKKRPRGLIFVVVVLLSCHFLYLFFINKLNYLSVYLVCLDKGMLINHCSLILSRWPSKAFAKKIVWLRMDQICFVDMFFFMIPY